MNKIWSDNCIYWVTVEKVWSYLTKVLFLEDRMQFPGSLKQYLPGCEGLYTSLTPSYIPNAVPSFGPISPILPSWCLHSLLLQSQANLIHQLQIQAAQSGNIMRIWEIRFQGNVYSIDKCIIAMGSLKRQVFFSKIFFVSKIAQLLNKKLQSYKKVSSS